MQVFVIGTPLETARALDKLRLNKQIIECQQILYALNGQKAWSKHPCTLQYQDHEEWLMLYMDCLCYYQRGQMDLAEKRNAQSMEFTPSFHIKEYIDNMKRRLYTKNNSHYNQWADMGESDVNWYYVSGKWKKYKDGKCLGVFDEIS